MKKIDYDVYCGDTCRRSLYWSQGTIANPTPIDISAYTAKMQIWGDDQLVPLFELTTENGGILKGPGINEIEFVLTNTQTASITKMKPSPYDLQITAPNGDVKTLLYGHMRWRRDRTK